MRLLTLALSFVFLMGCQQMATRGYEGSDPLSRLEDKAKLPLKYGEETVVLDARSAFDYGLGHWSEAIYFPWTKLAESESTGQLEKDPAKARLSLSLVGITPDTPVIVVGQGKKGNGEEGRLAWSLIYYGVTDVQTVSHNAIDVYFTRTETKPRKNAQPWKLPENESLVINRAAFLKSVTSSRVNPDGTKVLIIDVRSKEEYFAKQGNRYKEPDLQALHMEWKEFYGEDGRPNLEIKKRLQSLGYTTKDTIIVFSNRGVRSSAAAYSLLANGFKNVKNLL